MELTSVHGNYTRIASFLFLSLAVLFLVTSTGRVRTVDEIEVKFQGESLTLHGTTAVPQAVEANRFYGALDRKGQPRAPYGEAQALLSVPWHAAAQVLWIVLPQGGMPVGSKYLFVDPILPTNTPLFPPLPPAPPFLFFF